MSENHEETVAPRSARVFRIGALLAGLGALAVLFARFGLGDLTAAFANLSVSHLALYLALAGVVRLGFGLRWFLVARALGPAPALSRFVAARLAGDAVGALIPAGSVGGDPLRVLLLCGGTTSTTTSTTTSATMSATTASAGVALDRLLELVGNTICGMVYVTVFSATYALGPEDRTALVVGVLALLLASLAAPLVLLLKGVRPLTLLLPRALERRPRWRRVVGLIRRVEDDLVAALRQQPAVLLWGVAGSLAVEAAVVAEYWFLLAAFGIVVELPTLMMMLVTVGLVRAIPVPAGLGALEAGQVTVMAAVGRAGLGFLVGVVMRLHETLWIAVGLAALSRQGFSLARLKPAASNKSVVPLRGNGS